VTCENPAAWDDAALIERFLEGDDGLAWATLYARYNRKLVAVTVTALGVDEQTAKDAAHDAWVAVMSSPSLRPQGGFFRLLAVNAKWKCILETQRVRTARVAVAAMPDGQMVGTALTLHCRYCDRDAIAKDGLCHAHHKRRVRGLTGAALAAPIRVYG
jgi:hypothetical protein